MKQKFNNIDLDFSVENIVHRYFIFHYHFLNSYGMYFQWTTYELLKIKEHVNYIASKFPHLAFSNFPLFILEANRPTYCIVLCSS